VVDWTVDWTILIDSISGDPRGDMLLIMQRQVIKAVTNS